MSVLLLLVSVQPSALRSRPVGLVVAPAAVPSNCEAVGPQPIRSTKAPAAHCAAAEPQASVAVDVNSPTLPVVPLMLNNPVWSDAGSAAPTAPPDAICTR